MDILIVQPFFHFYYLRDIIIPNVASLKEKFHQLTPPTDNVEGDWPPTNLPTYVHHRKAFVILLTRRPVPSISEPIRTWTNLDLALDDIILVVMTLFSLPVRSCGLSGLHGLRGSSSSVIHPWWPPSPPAGTGVCPSGQKHFETGGFPLWVLPGTPGAETFTHRK